MKQFSLFVIVGSVGFLVDGLAFVSLLTVLGVHFSRIISFLIAVIVTFLLNKKFTFAKPEGSLTKYVAGQSVGMLLNFSIYEVTILLLGKGALDVTVAFLLGSATAMVFNFLFAKKIVFV